MPTSTTNITGFFHWMSGRSITSDCRKAVFSSSGSNRPALRLCRRASFSSSGAGPGPWAVPAMERARTCLVVPCLATLMFSSLVSIVVV